MHNPNNLSSYGIDMEEGYLEALLSWIIEMLLEIKCT
jgi:hypothetical protein